MHSLVELLNKRIIRFKYHFSLWLITVSDLFNNCLTIIETGSLNGLKNLT